MDANRGQAAFTRTGLALYDVLILRGLCPWIWRCPNERIFAAYGQHLSDNHLEVGVGTGYFLDRARFSHAAPRVALLDLNNARGTLHNESDTRVRLIEGLERHLRDVEVEQVGCVAVFSGRA